MLLALALGALVACHPSDQKLKTVRERVLDGDTVEFDKPGYGLCGKSAWGEMRIFGDGERGRIVLNQQRTVVAPGHAQCYHIGDVVSLRDMKSDVTPAGLVRIDRLALARLDRVRDTRLKGRFFATQSNSTRYKDGIPLKPDHEGIVTLVDVTYLNGSAVDEAALREADAQKSSEDAFEQTEHDGDVLKGGCEKANWKTLSFTREYEAEALSGALKSWYQLGEKNCLRQGQEFDLTDGFKGATIARAKVARVKRFAIRALEPKYFFLPEGFDFARLRTRIVNENTRDPKREQEFMTVVDFELLAAGGQ